MRASIAGGMPCCWSGPRRCFDGTERASDGSGVGDPARPVHASRVSRRKSSPHLPHGDREPGLGSRTGSRRALEARRPRREAHGPTLRARRATRRSGRRTDLAHILAKSQGVGLRFLQVYDSSTRSGALGRQFRARPNRRANAPRVDIQLRRRGARGVAGGAQVKVGGARHVLGAARRGGYEMLVANFEAADRSAASNAARAALRTMSIPARLAPGRPPCHRRIATANTVCSPLAHAGRPLQERLANEFFVTTADCTRPCAPTVSRPCARACRHDRRRALDRTCSLASTDYRPVAVTDGFGGWDAAVHTLLSF